MNDQLQAALAQVIGKATEGIDAGVSFLHAQLPDVIQQLLLWKLVANAALFGLAVVMIAVAIALAVIAVQVGYPDGHLEAKKALNRARDAYHDCTTSDPQWGEIKQAYRDAEAVEEEFESCAVMAIPYAFGAFVLAAVSLVPMNLIWLQIWLAPKVYLIEYAARLAK